MKAAVFLRAVGAAGRCKQGVLRARSCSVAAVRRLPRGQERREGMSGRPLQV